MRGLYNKCVFVLEIYSNKMLLLIAYWASLVTLEVIQYSQVGYLIAQSLIKDIKMHFTYSIQLMLN